MGEGGNDLEGCGGAGGMAEEAELEMSGGGREVRRVERGSKSGHLGSGKVAPTRDRV